MCVRATLCTQHGFRCPLTPLCVRVCVRVFARVCARTYAHTHVCAKALTEQELEFRSRVLQARSALVLPDLVYGLSSLVISCRPAYLGPCKPVAPGLPREGLP